jgi:hypothetical protein
MFAGGPLSPGFEGGKSGLISRPSRVNEVGAGISSTLQSRILGAMEVTGDAGMALFTSACTVVVRLDIVRIEVMLE